MGVNVITAKCPFYHEKYLTQSVENYVYTGVKRTLKTLLLRKTFIIQYFFQNVVIPVFIALNTLKLVR